MGNGIRLSRAGGSYLTSRRVSIYTRGHGFAHSGSGRLRRECREGEDQVVRVWRFWALSVALVVSGCDGGGGMFGGGSAQPAVAVGRPSRGKQSRKNVTKRSESVRRRDVRVIELEVTKISPDAKYIWLSGDAQNLQRVEVGDVFKLIHRISDLPASRYTSYHAKDHLIGEAEVVEVQKGTCRCKVRYKNTVNPIQIGNVAVAHLY